MPNLKLQITRHEILGAVIVARMVLAVQNPSLRPIARGYAVVRQA